MRYLRQSLVMLAVVAACVGLVGCADKEADWKQAESDAQAFWDALRTGKYADAHALCSPRFVTAKVPTAEFVAVFEGFERNWPGILASTVAIRANPTNSVRSGLFEFRVKHTWSNGFDPTKMKPVDGELPNVYRDLGADGEMSMIMELERTTRRFKVYYIGRPSKLTEEDIWGRGRASEAAAAPSVGDGARK